MKLAVAVLLSAFSILAQPPKPEWSAAEKPLYERIRTLRGLPDSERPAAEKDLAREIRQLPARGNKETLASLLANLVTEGDPGHATLQEAATTLAEALRDQPAASEDPWLTLAQLVRYEHVEVSLNDARFREAMAKLKAEDDRRDTLDFTLKDLDGKPWTRRQLTGKVVLVNFWATWCPPCRKEMPDLDALGKEFRGQGLAILAISDEDAATVSKFLAARPVSYPILLDPGDRVSRLFSIHGIPKTFVYDRSGKLAAESIDMRTRRQFLEMLRRAGIAALP